MTEEQKILELAREVVLQLTSENVTKSTSVLALAKAVATLYACQVDVSGTKVADLWLDTLLNAQTSYFDQSGCPILFNAVKEKQHGPS